MEKFIRGTLFCTLVTSLLIIIIDQIIVQPGQLGMGGFIAIVYVLPLSIVGCLIGELLQRGLNKLKHTHRIFELAIFLGLGFVIGLLFVNVFLFEVDDLTLPLISSLGSVTFYIGRNDK
ncbi:hypothetical protein [Paenibacillus tarimensis]|uniref:hypothetical protein n=1 Tax=Paenibacillus tarimensis TaxID=416012 RepID=UPI001F46686C|nr:hypothetical protein [Paenibacillus tarimensis]MCF2945307.1 hypothetical protein [Paenibacillus tarimensis]